MSQPVEKKEASAVKDEKQKVPEVSNTESVLVKILTNPWILIGGIITTVLLVIKGKSGNISSALFGNNDLEKRIQLLESELKTLRRERRQSSPGKGRAMDDDDEDEEEDSSEYDTPSRRSSPHRKRRTYYIQ